MLWAANFSVENWWGVEKAIRKAADDAKSSGSKEWFSFIDPEHVIAAIESGEVDAVLVEGYLIVMSMGCAWYNKDKVFLEELLVLRVSERPGNFRVVPDTLVQIACAIPNCAGICVGTALTQDDRLFRVYQRLGFKPQAKSLFRRI